MEKNDVVYTVPAGKRLVLERASFVGRVESGATAAVFLNSFGPLGSLAVPTEELGFFDGRGDVLVGNAAGPVYADAGASIRARVILSTPATAAAAFGVA